MAARKQAILQQFKAGNRPGESTGVPTDELRDFLKKKLTEIGKQTQLHEAQHEYAGAIDLVAERATKAMNRLRKETGQPLVRTPSVYRRLSGILAGESEITDLGIADALILACDSHIGLTDLTVLPGSRTGAERMVDAYRSSHKMTDKQRDKLVHALERFCLGYSNGPLICEDEDAIRRAEHRNNLAEKRRERRRKQETKVAA